jgi:hypothetical protein
MVQLVLLPATLATLVLREVTLYPPFQSVILKEALPAFCILRLPTETVRFLTGVVTVKIRVASWVHFFIYKFTTPALNPVILICVAVTE